jgi:drug/metabolite transporter (DMT)-like permease
MQVVSAPRSAGHTQENIPLGIIVMVVTAFTMAFGDALVKYVSTDFTLWQIYVLRSLVAIPILLALLLVRRRPASLLPISIKWTLLRCMLLMAMWIAFYAALPFLSLPVVAGAYYTGPLFITLFSALLIGESVGARRWAAILIGFIGVLVILRPGTDAFSYLTLLPIAAAVFYALAAVVTRTRCNRESPLVLSLALNISFMAVGIIGSAAIAIFDSASRQAAAYPFFLGHWTEMDGRDWGTILLLAAVIVATSSGVAKAYQSGPPAIIATFDYAYLVFAALWSFVIFSDVPDTATVIGMLLIAGAGVLVLRSTGQAVSQATRPVLGGPS